MTFSRGLTPAFVEELKHGRFAPLLSTAKAQQLDIQIRNRYLDFYANGQRALNLKEMSQAQRYRALLHWKYLAGLEPPGGSTRMVDGQYLCFEASDAFTTECLALLPAIVSNARSYATAEGTVEERMIGASFLPDSPAVFFDRQVEVPGTRLRADLLGLGPAADGVPQILLVELKHKLNNSIQRLMGQVEAYYRLIAPTGTLAPDVLASYRRVISQKHELGLLPPHIALPEDAPRVACLLVLYDYNDRSRLLPRLRVSARGSSLPVQLVCLEADTYTLPTPECWEKLT